MKQKRHYYCTITLCAIMCFLGVTVIHRMSSPFILTLPERMADAFGSEWNFLEEIQIENETDEGSCERLLQRSGSVKCNQEDLFVRYPGKCPISKSYYQPNGCNIFTYNNSNIKECMGKISPQAARKEILFLGDSRMRYVYDTLKYKLQDINFTVYPVTKLLKKQYYDHEETGMIIKFLWDRSVDEETMDTLNKIMGSKIPPLLVTIGNTLHPIKMTGGTIEGFHEYKRNFTAILPILKKLTNITTVIWMIQPPVKHSFEGTNNLMIQLYNNVAEQLLNGTHVHLMQSAHTIGKETVNYYPDLLHLGKTANKMIVEIILNYLCNNHTTIEEENICCKT